MKKLLYVTDADITKPGVLKKIENQHVAFEEFGFEVSTTYFDGDYFCINRQPVCKINRNRWYRLKSRFLWPRKIDNTILKDGWDLVYIRKPIISFGFLKFVKKLKMSGSKVVLEIPTYPYDAEIKGFVKEMLFKVEVYCRSRLKGKVDLITYYGDGGESIWGLPALKLNNGIVTGDFELPQKNGYRECINFIAVAQLANWHGYDRFIRAISTLNKEYCEAIHFNIVGEGNELENLKRLVNDLNLNSVVTFHGFLEGDNLSSMYRKSDIGVGCLGIFRKGLLSASSLKVREYCSYGIPFIYSEIDEVFTNVDFAYKVQHDETDIDLNKILNWYKGLEYDGRDIQEFARNQLSWTAQIKKIISKLDDMFNE